MIPVFMLVHPIDTKQHPTYPPGWRWAVMVGEGSFSDMDRCANAGQCATRDEALHEADRHMATAVAASRIMAVMTLGGRSGSVVELDHDPVPPEADDQPLRMV